METYAPQARSEHFDLPHIGKDKIADMYEVVKKSSSDKQKLMVEVFNNLKKGTTFQVIEKNQNNADKTDVILRQDNGSGGGIRGPRFPHGTGVELISTPGRENINGYSFRTMRDSKGQERIYVHVRINGQEGYMAMEHVGIKDIPVDITDVVPTTEEKKPEEEQKQDAVPTTEEKKPEEEQKQDAVPTTEEKKPEEEQKQDAVPTTEEKKPEEEQKQDAVPTTEEKKPEEEQKQDAVPTPPTEKKPEEEQKQDAVPTTEEKKPEEEQKQDAVPNDQKESESQKEDQENNENGVVNPERARYPDYYIIDSDGDWTPDRTGLPMLDTKKLDYWTTSALKLIRQVGGPEEMVKLLDMEINGTIGFNRAELRAKTDKGLFFLDNGLGDDKSDFFDTILAEYKKNNNQIPAHLIEPYYAEKK